MNMPQKNKTIVLSIGSVNHQTLKIAPCYDPLNEFNQNIQTNGKITMDFVQKRQTKSLKK